jgi:protein gp37
MSGNGNHATVKGASLTMMCQQQDVPFFFKQWGGIKKKDW